MKYYVDLRTMELEDEITLNVNFLAPELYYEFGKSYGNFYKETWYVGNGGYLDFAFSEKDLELGTVKEQRDNHFKYHNAEPVFLKKFLVPPKKFEEALKYYGYDKD